MKRTLACLALLLGPPLSAAACLWDRDTPAEEALGMPEVVAALTGRFDRNPPLFYKRPPDRPRRPPRSRPPARFSSFL